MTHDGRKRGEVRVRHGRRVRRWGATLIAVTVAVVLTSCSSAPTPTAPASTTSATSAAPEATAAPTETAPTGNADITFNVEANKHSTLEQFKSRPRDEQLAYVQNMLDFEISDAPASETLARSPVPYGDNRKMEDWNPAIPGVLSRENNGQEIVNISSFLEAFANAQPVDPNAQSTSKADLTQERKLLAGVYYYADAKKDPTGRYAISDKTITSSETTQVLNGADRMRVDKFSPVQKGVDKDGQAVEYVDCWVNSDGNTEIQRYYYHTFVAKDNQEHSLWLLADIRKP